MAWLGCRALADVGDGRRRTGSGAPGGAGWDATAAGIDELVEAACGPDAVVGVRPTELRVLCAAERTYIVTPDRPDEFVQQALALARPAA